MPHGVVDDVVSAAIARMGARHPSLAERVVDSVVYQAATELVSTVVDAEQLGRLLDRRAHARLTAMSGAPIAIHARRHA